MQATPSHGRPLLANVSGFCSEASLYLSLCLVFNTHDFDRVRGLENELLVAADHMRGFITLVNPGHSSRGGASPDLRVELLRKKIRDD
jgi:hypothetical protein